MKLGTMIDTFSSNTLKSYSGVQMKIFDSEVAHPKDRVSVDKELNASVRTITNTTCSQNCWLV